MMFDDKGLALVAGALAAIGAAIAFALWAFRVIPAWGILVGAIGTPVVVLGLIFAIFVFAWMDGGSH